jgi:MFS family permease
VKGRSSLITSWLQRTHGVWFTIYASLAAFCFYTCVYTFRKTFASATFEGLALIGISYKVWLVTSQVIGYALSKFIGIKIISELKAHSRAKGILLLVTVAGVSWLLFALIPAPYNIVCLFFNGLPLGMVWGMVFGYLEGRRMTEILGASLSVSFIFSAGLCRTVGAYLVLDWGISEYWMPFAASCIFILPLLIFLYLLNQLPPPSLMDEQLRTKRLPMNASERKKFTITFLPGIILFVLTYVSLTAFRDFRDNFSAEIWKSLGFSNPSIYTSTEVPVSIAVLICMGSLMLIKNNKLALMVNHIIIAFGMILIGVANYLFEQTLISPHVWMILIGLGLYLGYIPFNSIFFDRLIATFQYASTVGFIMYVADSFGYLGSVSVLFFKEFGFAKLSWLHFFISGGYVVSITGTIFILASMVYFHQKHKNWKHVVEVSEWPDAQ